MDKETLRKVQLTQLEIAKEFKRICEENNLTYIMEGGTLLGAVRHKGFIPWDDDMDFSMPRKDYDRFFEIASKLDTKYEPVRWDMTEHYPHPFGKFVKKGSIYKEEKMDASYGIYIDIFPWDEYPDDKKEEKKYISKLMIYRALVRAKCGVRTYYANGKFIFGKWLKNVPFILLKGFFKKSTLVNKYETLAQKYNGKFMEELTCQCETVPGSWNGPRSVFERRTDLIFEDTSFASPEDYDGFLKRGYGDYMKLPPVEKRGNQHLIVEIDFGD